MKLLTYDPAKNRTVLCGELIGDTLFRDVEAKHFMRVVQGYGIQEVAFQKILEEGIKKIVLKEKHTKKNWEATTDRWIDKGKVIDYGHGKQRFLSMKYMKNHLIPEIDVR